MIFITKIHKKWELQGVFKVHVPLLPLHCMQALSSACNVTVGACVWKRLICQKQRITHSIEARIGEQGIILGSELHCHADLTHQLLIHRDYTRQKLG